MEILSFLILFHIYEGVHMMFHIDQLSKSIRIHVYVSLVDCQNGKGGCLYFYS